MGENWKGISSWKIGFIENNINEEIFFLVLFQTRSFGEFLIFYSVSSLLTPFILSYSVFVTAFLRFLLFIHSLSLFLSLSLSLSIYIYIYIYLSSVFSPFLLPFICSSWLFVIFFFSLFSFSSFETPFYLSLCLYLHFSLSLSLYIYIYILRERERERERERRIL